MGWTAPFCIWSWYNGDVATCAIPMNYHKTAALDKPTFAADWRINWGFMSAHPGGGNMGLVDGSVRFVPETVDLSVYHALGTISSGEVAQMP